MDTTVSTAPVTEEVFRSKPSYPWMVNWVEVLEEELSSSEEVVVSWSMGTSTKLALGFVTDTEEISSVSRLITSSVETEVEEELSSDAVSGWVSSSAAAPPPTTTSTASIIKRARILFFMGLQVPPLQEDHQSGRQNGHRENTARMMPHMSMVLRVAVMSITLVSTR